MTRHRMPIVHLTVLQPIVRELRTRGIDHDAVLASVGLEEGMLVDPQAAVHVMVVHQFLENAAKAARDPYLCAMIGRRLDVAGWPILQRAEAAASTVADYLSIYVDRANEVASSVTAYLSIEGQQAVFGEKRVFEPSIVPAQNDAYMAALSLAILDRAVGPRLDPSRVTIAVSDPSVLPAEYAFFRLLRGDRMGYRLQFPTAWLTAPLYHAERGESIAAEDDRRMMPATGFVAAFRQVLRARIGQGGFTAEDAASLVSMTRPTLARRLARYGTDISAEIAAVRQAYAEAALLETDRSIADIAAALGYSDAANFTRAFRRATGKTPTEFRQL